MNERIKEIRLNLGLSQEEFGERLGLSRGAITNIELNKTDPKPRFVALLCREFNVNESWLRSGEGEMFISPSKDDVISDFIGDVLSDDKDFRRRFISALAALDREEWEAIEKAVWKLVEEMQKPGQ